MGFELTNTQTVIKRSGIFDEVDAKYGISEDERQAAEAATAAEGGGEAPELGGAMGAPPAPSGPPSGGGEEPLSEGKKAKLISSLGGGDKLEDLFNMEKAQRNIYEMENKLKDILND
jgi:hypothetical protein